jgi:hypothetical protein
MYTMCMHYVTKLFTLVYAFYERKPDKIKPEFTEMESHWGQWSMIDEN